MMATANETVLVPCKKYVNFQRQDLTFDEL